MIVVYIFVFLVPLIFILSGILLRVYPPKYDGMYGYRSRRAYTNEDTWQYAQKCATTFLCIISTVLLVATIVILLLYGDVLFRGPDSFPIRQQVRALAILLAQTVVILLIYPYTEIRLIIKFGKHVFKQN